MKFDYIKLNNFRQYYGEQVVFFAKSADKNVTIIHGENGFGKTALLNALQWCLYGKVTLPDPEILINERAEAEAEEGAILQVAVELRFRDANKDYTVRRSKTGVKRKGRYEHRSDEFSVSYIDESGRSRVSKNPQVAIDQVLPRGMAPYFFFDGERIDQMGGREGSREIQEAIKNIMGLEILERGIAHMKDVQRVFSKELEEFGSNEIQELLQKKRAKEEALRDREKEKNTIAANIESLEEHKAAVEERLRNNQETRDLQKEKDNLLRLKDEYQSLMKEKEGELKDLCSRRGFLAFSKPLIDKISAEIEARRVKGEIPSGIKQQFVQDLLDIGRCICDRCLEEGTQPYQKVQAWLDKSGNKDLEDAFAQTSAYIKLLKELRNELFISLKNKQKERQDILSKLDSVHEKIDEVEARLDGKDSEEVHSLVKTARDIDNKIYEENRKLGEVSATINIIRVEISEIDSQIDEVRVEEGKAELAKRRMNACVETKEILDEIYAEVAKRVRQDCQERIAEIYSKFLKKPYRALLQDNYELKIVKNVGGESRPVALSQGERQVTSLSFIGALVDIARRNFEEKKKFYVGGIYPIVMDSPFGQLDPEHRRNIAEGMPSLAPQVVLMVAEQQWTDEIRQALLPRVGKEYSLVNYNPKKNPDVRYEHTEIVEGGYGQ